MARTLSSALFLACVALVVAVPLTGQQTPPRDPSQPEVVWVTGEQGVDIAERAQQCAAAHRPRWVKSRKNKRAFTFWIRITK